MLLVMSLLTLLNLLKMKEKIEQLETIIKCQHEIIEILKMNVESRDKFINILERQLKIAENYTQKTNEQ